MIADDTGKVILNLTRQDMLTLRRWPLRRRHRRPGHARNGGQRLVAVATLEDPD